MKSPRAFRAFVYSTPSFAILQQNFEIFEKNSLTLYCPKIYGQYKKHP